MKGPLLWLRVDIGGGPGVRPSYSDLTGSHCGRENWTPLVERRERFWGDDPSRPHSDTVSILLNPFFYLYEGSQEVPWGSQGHPLWSG